LKDLASLLAPARCVNAVWANRAQTQQKFITFPQAMRETLNLSHFFGSAPDPFAALAFAVFFFFGAFFGFKKASAAA
jgi:hypothetical protein